MPLTKYMGMLDRQRIGSIGSAVGYAGLSAIYRAECVDGSIRTMQ